MKAEVKAEGGNARDTAKGGNQRGQGGWGNQREPARKLQRVVSRLRADGGEGGEGGGDEGGEGGDGGGDGGSEGGAGGGGGGGGGGGEGPCLGFPDDATASPSSPSHGGAHTYAHTSLGSWVQNDGSPFGSSSCTYDPS